jgi:DNA-binding FrmR family transcriptional regulator
LRTAADRRGDTDHELAELIKSVGDDNDELRRANEQQFEENQLLQLQVMEKEDEVRALRREFEEYKVSTREAFDRCRQLESQMHAIENLAELPSSLAEVLTLIAALHPDKIVLTEDAIKTAESAGLEDKSLDDAWRCLWSIPTILHPLFFEDGQPNDKEGAYRDRSGFDLAMSEGKQTKKQTNLMALRTRRFNGREIDITPHVKMGNRAPKCLRVHFAIDRENGRFIIGHCGDHLQNYTSQFQN